MVFMTRALVQLFTPRLAVAIVVAAAGASPSEADLIAFARDRLARYKLPKSIDFTAALPRNPSGKLLKRQLREPYWEGVERRIH